MSFRRLGEILPQTLEEMGLLQRVRVERVVRAWPRAAGRAAPELAEGVEAVDLRAGVLSVRVPDGRLARLLERCSAEIVRALNAELGERAVERVVRVG
jgi:predicted nucleic acid-binding Zn ribbon protein